MRGGIREEWGDSLDAGVWLLAKSRFWGIALMGGVWLLAKSRFLLYN